MIFAGRRAERARRLDELALPQRPHLGAHDAREAGPDDRRRSPGSRRSAPAPACPRRSTATSSSGKPQVRSISGGDDRVEPAAEVAGDRRPMSQPSTSVTVVAMTATSSEMPVPATVRQRRSRPYWSVPSRCPSTPGREQRCRTGSGRGTGGAAMAWRARTPADTGDESTNSVSRPPDEADLVGQQQLEGVAEAARARRQQPLGGLDGELAGRRHQPARARSRTRGSMSWWAMSARKLKKITVAVSTSASVCASA